mgnify:CR=1 FL=1
MFHTASNKSFRFVTLALSSNHFLTVDSKITINIKVKAESTGYFLQFTDTITGESRTIPLVQTSESGKYLAKIEDVSAESLLHDFTLAVIDENNNVLSHTLGYNIEKYIYGLFKGFVGDEHDEK